VQHIVSIEVVRGLIRWQGQDLDHELAGQLRAGLFGELAAGRSTRVSAPTVAAGPSIPG
jgi:hypothetical protein